MALRKLESHYLEISKVLIIAPKRVAQYTWPNEIKKWDDFKDLTYSIVIGTEKQRLQALKKDALIYLINRENVEWLYRYLFYEKDVSRFDTIIVDESSSFKNASTKRFKALKKMAIKCPRLLILTGTPAPKGLMDLWSQIYLLDQGQRLGRTLTEYRKRYFTPGRSNGHVVYDWIAKPEAEESIYEAISDIVVSMKSVDYLDMPERIDNNIELVMSDKVKRIYDDFKKDFILELEDDVITAATAGVLCNKLLQLSNGALYKSDGSYEVIHDYKLEALEEILENNPEVPILVLYNYKSDLARLKEYFQDLEPKTIDDKNALDDWDKKKIRLLLANPASMGHGLNMQTGGSIIVWFGLTFNLELYQQANSRLYRQGQKDTVIIHHLIIKDSEDERVMERLSQKDHIQNSLIDYVKAEIRRIKKNGKIN
ncbi:MAG: DEAD/DEAH box helicase [Anaeroplasma bactoclasticum]|nr:DEAD/DEAH box helicase [Anaeroplasma bactoclasticum]MCM1556882.1 DEAD/DEAH box helicase [Anaeroplasma bactoclasticum]